MSCCQLKAGLLITIAILTLSLSASAQDYQRETDRLAEEIAAAVTKANLRNVAVMDFTDLQGNVQEIGRFMAEELTTSLVLQNRSFKTIDRANLRSILSEQKLTMTGLVNLDNARKLKISGVDGLIRGSLTPFGDGIRITIQIIAVETAQIVGAARGVVPKTSAMDNLGGAIEDASQLPLASSPSSSQPAKGKYVFQDDTLRITLRSFRKDTDNKIRAVFLFENLKSSRLNIYWYNPGLFDDHAAKWESESNSIQYPTSILPSTPLLERLVLKQADGTSGGTKFSVFGEIKISDDARSWVSTPVFQNLQLGL